MNKLTYDEIHAFIIGFDDGFYDSKPKINRRVWKWLYQEYHYYSFGRTLGTIFPYVAGLALGIIIGVMI